ncbi:hypothetical protein OB955_01590 [Halobacteria archaeon AArc-m2/3/4]|uniref:Uncharacterized protein n=1 Tax=Natronoglomus mannanivorans TaxID=2979990 RepID=A0ABT2Q928_9EURY|nr:hypothetical protein [Halobacteria archaeon AArc-m2/3/4]
MTGTSGKSRRRVSIAGDDRGRIPFAMIAVLLLVASVGLIAALEQRSEPTIDQDTEAVMDRTATAAQSELRTAVLDATHQAGAAPINTTNGSQVDRISATSDQSEAFRNYVKLLVYVEAADRLPESGQSIDSDTESTVSLPPVSTSTHGEPIAITPNEAIDRVDLEVGYLDDHVERGTIDATVHDVEFDAVVDGESVPTETRSVSVTAGSPVFELNERMTEYETQLNKGFFDGEGTPDPTDVDGLGQEMALRLYPMAYLKSSWDRFGNRTTEPDDHAFEEVIDTDHAEVFANHAIFSVQEDVFGTSDPYSDRTMRPQYLCTSLDLATTISDVDLEADLNNITPSENITFSDDLGEQADQFNESESDSENTTVPVDGEVDFEAQLCGDDGTLNEWVFGDEATGDLPEVPPLSELLQDGIDSMDVADHEIEVPVDVLARATFIEYHVEGYAGYDDPEAYLDDLAAEQRGLIEEEGGAVDNDFVGGAPGDGSTDYDRSPGDIVDNIYTLDVSTDEHSSADTVATPRSAGVEYDRDYSNDSEIVLDATVTTVDHTPIPDGADDDHDHDHDYDRPIHELSAEATVDVRITHGWEATNKTETSPNYTTTTTRQTLDVTTDTTIEGEYGFDGGGEYYISDTEFRVARDPIETDYGSHANATFERGFEQALVDTTNAESYHTAEDDIAAALESSLRRSSPSTLERSARNGVVATSSTVVSADDILSPSERRDLIESLNDELETVHQEFTSEWQADPLHVEIRELTDGETPPARAIEHIQTEFEDEYVGRGPYETPEDKAQAQIRKAYFDRLYYWLALSDEEYGGQMDDVDDQIDEIGGDAGFNRLDDALGFVQGFANADVDPDPVDLEGSAVLDDAQYEISGAPTYLTTTSINRSQSAAIRPVNATITDVDSDVHHDPMAIQTHNRAPWPGVPVVFVLPSKWYATVNFWSVDIQGEYARLEVSSTVGDPADTDRLTYVAEHSPVAVELSDGSTVQVGKNEAVDFETETEVVVIMPGAVVQRGPVPAVADGQFVREGTTYCSDTWEEVGPDADSVVIEEECD